MCNKYKLHPISSIINFLKGLKEFTFPFILVVIANGFNFSANEKDIWEYIPSLILLAVLIFYLIAGIIRWWTFVYWFEENELRVEYGLFVKKKRYIPYDRIQGINYKEGIFHRIFGLVQVMVETAGSSKDEPEVILTAITKEAAAQIEKETSKLAEQKVEEKIGIEVVSNIEEEVRQEPKVIHKMSNKDLVLLATTSNSVGVVIAGVVATFSQISDFIPYDKIFEELATFIQFGFVVITFAIFFALFIAWMISVIMTFINYYDFTVIQENDRFIITRGLLEKKRITIPIHRVQAIKIAENPFRQLMKYATVVVESASGGIDKSEQKITLFPLILKKDMNHRLEQLFPQYHFLSENSFVQSPKIAKSFYYRKEILWLIPIVIGTTYFFFPYGLLTILLVVPLFLLALWQYKTNGFNILGNQLTLRYRLISRVTFIVEKNRIQAVQSRQSYFQKRKMIASVRATVMSGSSGTTAKVPHLRETDVNKILSWFERSSENKEVF